MKMNKAEIFSKIQELLGFPIKSGGIRNIDLRRDIVAIFSYEILKNEPFYWIAAEKYLSDKKDYILLDDKWQIMMVPAEIITNIEDHLVQAPTFRAGTENTSGYWIYNIPVNLCSLIYHEDRGLITENIKEISSPPPPVNINPDNGHKNVSPLKGGTGAYAKQSQRDYACIHLKVPESEDAWLNSMIIKSRQYDLEMMEKLTKRLIND